MWHERTLRIAHLRGSRRGAKAPLQGRLNGVDVKDRHVSPVRRWEPNACERLLEVVAGPPAADVVLRLPNTDDVQGLLADGAVVPQLTAGNSTPPTHDQLVSPVVGGAQFVDVAVEAGDQHRNHLFRVVPRGLSRMA